MENTYNSRKIKTGKDVLSSAIERISWLFDTFGHLCLSFSGGKDSTVLFHILADVARKKKKRFSVLFIDWEAQYKYTIQHVEKMKEKYQDVTDNFYWVALPLTTVNGVSQYQPEWVCWERGVSWVRTPPSDAITQEFFFPFYYYAMTFEEFITEFSQWFSCQKTKTVSAILTGVRADESLKRFIGLVSQRKLRYADDKPWTTASPDGFSYIVYPLYDWKVSDIWTYNAKTRSIYNPLYDLMYRAGVPVNNMRICEPFGPEQRCGLWLYHALEPETWSKMCSRVAGATSGAIYANESGDFYALRKRITKPAGHSWRSYAMFLLNVMPEKTSEHYKNKISIYLRWYQMRGYPDDIPDEQENDLGGKDIPSWRRICKMLLKNDFWCRMLSFSPTKPKYYEQYVRRIQKKRSKWGIL
ncbi:phosphoadenosine phosphosulfate reductase [Yersinia enterocolitica]|uniref:phosphoadenosine phosphosulfate reductase n=1 Tax=Yersinia enterocolitica TaxID=630 RepID=UPI001F5950AF|nr:DUF3440 domain-containing protein [Yersinia enterocolitica]HDL7797738.1 DUF3440 domain-containing protein [Yersinia enterocolitica]HEI6730683.1 DUF3440 domain-containing protein [Yersinia enterocolitica]HEI6819204.1 DUF3440 domain-containing protein [Yersinia enterocolitica]